MHLPPMSAHLLPGVPDEAPTVKVRWKTHASKASFCFDLSGMIVIVTIVRGDNGERRSGKGRRRGGRWIRRGVSARRTTAAASASVCAFARAATSVVDLASSTCEGVGAGDVALDDTVARASAVPRGAAGA